LSASKHENTPLTAICIDAARPDDGEAQRIKLAKELSKRATGLHFHDVKKLLEVLHEQVAHGNTVKVIEHNLEVIKTADWVIDLGPEGGDGGGEIVPWGPPEDSVRAPRSYTGKFWRRCWRSTGSGNVGRARRRSSGPAAFQEVRHGAPLIPT
jgi:excinuclease ABC subunit A